tara:strand:- start:489 stop:2999 length:2511 start_codon:yes stop_codon:yes gene_type:complete
MDTDKNKLPKLYKNWFLEYASYVILERAIPRYSDGLKPVQRRILYSMKNIDDGRFHKVANIIGNTMQYHPHGDQSIGDALVNIGQKNLLVETQGNWGDVNTGDKAAAPRYIEARLSSFAKDVLFNHRITDWVPSYDGRNKEPIELPVKFPLLLTSGAEGIAVGLSTKIMPHNFNELIKSSIAILEDKSFKIYPDFPSGGLADFSNYKNGKKGGKIRVRSEINIVDKKTLSITSVPYGTNTQSLIESILKANNLGKIKIKKVEDNTAENVNITIHLAQGISPDVTIEALYGFTNCEISISPNCCVIGDNKPEFLGVNDLLRLSTDRTVNILKNELTWEKKNQEEKWHYANLERLFIEHKIYRKIEECNTWEAVLKTIELGLKPFQKDLKKEITKDDIVRLTEIKIKKISKYDSDNNSKHIANIELELEEINNHLNNLNDYTIRYFKSLLNKYGDMHQRKTKISTFDAISVRRVVVANKKLYVNRKEGFIGYGIKNEEYVKDCSDIDNVIVFKEDGKFIITQIDSKKYVGKNIIHIDVWRKNNPHMVYNIAYKDGESKFTYVKRFSVLTAVTNKEYDLTQGADKSKILYFTANPNSESEIVNVFLHHSSSARKKEFIYNFDSISIKSRTSKGNILSKYAIRSISQKEVGSSTLGGRKIWFDNTIGKLNHDERGEYLGSFNTDDSILIIKKDGTYYMTDFELTNRYKPDEIFSISKFNSDISVTAVHFDGKSKSYYIKRFLIETNSLNTPFLFISKERASKLIAVTLFKSPSLFFNYRLNNGEKKGKEILISDFVGIKGWKAIGNKILKHKNMSAFKFIENEIQKEEEDVSDQETLTLF